MHWDQRGAGASCAGVNWKTLTLSRLIEDLIELAEIPGKGKKIGIIGHSWGSLVAIKAVRKRPDLFYAYIGTGQLVHRDHQEEHVYRWTMAQAIHEKNAEAFGNYPPSTRHIKLNANLLSSAAN